MKSLETIQKTFSVFKILSKVAIIISFVVVGVSILGMSCAMVWENGGTVVGLEKDAMMSMTETSSFNEIICYMLSDTVFALTDGILALFAFLYFKAELEDGTPFTQNGAARIKRLGIQTIVLPLVAEIISEVIYSCFGLKHANDWGSGVAVVLGITLILASLVFRYGAELEAREKYYKE